MQTLDNWFLKSFICFDNEGEGEPDPESKEKDTEDEKVVPQSKVNELLAREKRKTQEVQRKLAAQLEEQKKNEQLSSSEREALESQIDELRRQTMTAEELAKEQADRMAKEHNERLQRLEEERDHWHSRHDELVINSEIVSASAKHEAASDEQIAALLRPKTKMTVVVDESGKPTGETIPKVSFTDTNKEGKPVVLELSVNDAVKRMKELDRYSNLFKNDKNGGIGGSGQFGPKGNKIDLVRIAREDPKRYRQLVKERPELLN